MEFIIQIEPYQFDSVRDGSEEITSEVPPNLRGHIWRYCVRSGMRPLPQEQPPPAEAPADEALSAPDRLEAPAMLSTHLAQQTDYEESTRSAKPDTPADVPPSTPAAGQPWLTLVAVLIAFFAALAGLMYSSWIAWDYRRRYQQLLAQTAAMENA